MNRYKFKHPLLGDNEVELIEDMVFSYFLYKDFYSKDKEMLINIRPEELANFGLNKREFKSLTKV